MNLNAINMYCNQSVVLLRNSSELESMCCLFNSDLSINTKVLIGGDEPRISAFVHLIRLFFLIIVYSSRTVRFQG